MPSTTAMIFILALLSSSFPFSFRKPLSNFTVNPLRVLDALCELAFGSLPSVVKHIAALGMLYETGNAVSEVAHSCLS